ncbi:SDR family oxidoreductase [Peribacillus kribbensis]|uniref:SDR family oxidoreductase n=1 Tax=Peribacillus kribbensis TaxID=356658 RepID=UPI000406908E|nr:SDR family oxidoreductase [Peribacillus kribbensis]
MENKLFDLTSKTAIVTGGGRGLGKQIAEGLAEAGANIVVCSRNLAACNEVCTQLKEQGVNILAFSCDITKKEEIQNVIDETIKAFGKIDILVNNSGISWISPVVDYPEDKWKMVMDVNVNGTFLFSQAAVREMLKQSSGKIINIASIAGHGGTPPEVMEALAYNTSKGAVITFTKDLALKLAKYGIQVNAIAPGFFPTKITSKVLQSSFLKGVPAGRFGGDSDLKGAAVFLASNASDYMTGQILNIDGGITAQA